MLQAWPCRQPSRLATRAKRWLLVSALPAWTESMEGRLPSILTRSAMPVSNAASLTWSSKAGRLVLRSPADWPALQLLAVTGLPPSCDADPFCPRSGVREDAPLSVVLPQVRASCSS